MRTAEIATHAPATKDAAACRPDSNEFHELEAKLLEMKRVLREDVESLEREADGAASQAPGSLSHLADRGTDAAEHHLSLERRGAATDVLQEVADALDRLRDGSFGVCEDCGKPISEARLEAIPYTRLCIPCKIEAEQTQGE